MKTIFVKWLIGMLLFNIQVIVYSQNDSLFSTEGETYSIEYSFSYGGFGTYYCGGEINHYYLKESLYYNDTLYQKVNQTIQSIVSCYYTSKLDTGCTSPYGYICYINKKLYFKDSLEQLKPVLVYDFNLNVGDTFLFTCKFTNTNNQIDTIVDTLTVLWLDSITLGGISRKRISFSYPQVPEDSITWVEGLGDIHHGFLMFDYGPFICQYYPDWPPRPNYRCARTPQEIIYGWGDVYVDCHATGTEDILSEDFKINNPVTTQLILTLPESTAHIVYSLYDMQGSLKLEGKTTSSQAEINVTDLPRGIYILKVETDNHILTKKVALQ